MRKNFKPALGFIFVTLLLDITGIGIIVPIMPQFIREITGQSLSHASMYTGWLMFAYALMQFIFAPVIGNLSDRYGRRPVLLISLFGFFINYLVMAFAPTLGWLFAGRILAGITGASMTAATAYIADISTPEKRAQNFGIVGAAFGLGFILGPALGGLLGHYGFRVPFYAAAAVTFINWLFGYFILPESLEKENRRKFDIKRANPVGSLLQLKKYPLIAGLIGAYLLICIAGQTTNSTWSFYTMEKFGWDSRMVGISLSVVGLMLAIIQGWLIRIIHPKLGMQRSIFIGISLYAVGFLLVAFAPSAFVLYLALIPFCLGGIGGPALQGYISNQVQSNEQGELQGALTSLASLAAIVGPLMMSGLFSYFTGKSNPVYLPGAPFILAGVLTFVALIYIVRSFKWKTEFDIDELPEDELIPQPIFVENKEKGVK
jgi:MFS transporter, DHA1 family, tetracycline resistance protein